jgi:hypothetical protein
MGLTDADFVNGKLVLTSDTKKKFEVCSGNSK